MREELTELWRMTNERANQIKELEPDAAKQLARQWHWHHAHRPPPPASAAAARPHYSEGAPPPWEGFVDQMHLWGFYISTSRAFVLNLTQARAANATLLLQRRDKVTAASSGAGGVGGSIGASEEEEEEEEEVERLEEVPVERFRQAANAEDGSGSESGSESGSTSLPLPLDMTLDFLTPIIDLVNYAPETVANSGLEISYRSRQRRSHRTVAGGGGGDGGGGDVGGGGDGSRTVAGGGGGDRGGGDCGDGGDGSTGIFISLVAERDIAAGEEITWPYHHPFDGEPTCNHWWLLEYGFFKVRAECFGGCFLCL